ncbi:MAG: alpha/beta hydrolase family protein, partial [Alcanivoracaceae bacterium]
MTQTFTYTRIPYMVAFAEKAEFKDTYAGPMDMVALEAHLLKPEGRTSDTVIVFMHPVGGGAYLPMVSALAKAGHHVIYCNSRYRGADAPLIMEKVVADLGACIRDAKERLGYDKVV